MIVPVFSQQSHGGNPQARRIGEAIALDLGGYSVDKLWIDGPYLFPKRPMKQGRPPSWNPFSYLEPTVWTEVSEFGSKGRLGIPAAARRRLDWWPNVRREGLLATLEPGGMAKLEPWSEVGLSIINHVEHAVATAGPTQKSEVALAAMDRYMHVSCEDDGRLMVPGNLVAHLDPGGSRMVRIVAKDGTLWLWSEDRWQDQRAGRISLFGSFLK